jgi:hypothetical protein
MRMISALRKLREVRAFWCPPFVAAGADPLKPSVPRRVLGTTGTAKMETTGTVRILQGMVDENRKRCSGGSALT